MSYLARLALRALGRPVDARLLPRADARAAWARQHWESEAPIDARGSEGVPLLEQDTRDAGADVPEGVDAAARGVSASSGEPAPRASSPSARGTQLSSPRVHARSRPAAPIAFRSQRAAVAAEERVQLAAPAQSSGDPSALEPRRAARQERSVMREASPREAPADEDAPRIGATASAPPHSSMRLPEPHALDQRAEAHAPSVVDSTDALREIPAVRATPEALRASTSYAPLRERAAISEPASVHVEIGRIEVKVAPPPPAPPMRARARPEGFEGYWRMRNYLDRVR